MLYVIGGFLLGFFSYLLGFWVAHRQANMIHNNFLHSVLEGNTKIRGYTVIKDKGDNDVND